MKQEKKNTLLSVLRVIFFLEKSLIERGNTSKQSKKEKRFSSLIFCKNPQIE